MSVRIACAYSTVATSLSIVPQLHARTPIDTAQCSAAWRSAVCSLHANVCFGKFKFNRFDSIRFESIRAECVSVGLLLFALCGSLPRRTRYRRSFDSFDSSGPPAHFGPTRRVFTRYCKGASSFAAPRGEIARTSRRKWQRTRQS